MDLQIERSSKNACFDGHCYYNLLMPTWDERKQRTNIKRHGLDFEGAEAIWDNLTVTREDIRHSYGEARFVTFGLLDGEAVVLVTPSARAISISFLFAELRNMKHVTTLKPPKKLDRQ